MIVLDTNVVSELFRPAPNAAVVSWIEGLAGEVAVTAVTMGELLAGVRRLPDGRRRDELERSIDAIVTEYRDTDAVLPFNDEAALHYADIVVRRSVDGRPIATADAQIAAICRAHDATCATRNTKDFEGCGISLVDPWTN